MLCLDKCYPCQYHIPVHLNRLMIKATIYNFSDTLFLNVSLGKRDGNQKNTKVNAKVKEKC